MARVLVVDDDPSIGQLMTASLGADGHEVVVLMEGLPTHAHAAANPVDVILLDVILPDTNGIHVLSQLKADPATANIPVILITGQDDEESEADGMESGAEFYFTKPMNMGLLSATVAMLVTDEVGTEVTMIDPLNPAANPAASPTGSMFDDDMDLDLIRQQLSDL